MSQSNLTIDEDWIEDVSNNDNDFFQHDPECLLYFPLLKCINFKLKIIDVRCLETLDNLEYEPQTSNMQFSKCRKDFVLATQHSHRQDTFYNFGDCASSANLDEFGKELNKLGVEIRILNGDEHIFFTSIVLFILKHFNIFFVQFDTF